MDGGRGRGVGGSWVRGRGRGVGGSWGDSISMSRSGDMGWLGFLCSGYGVVIGGQVDKQIPAGDAWTLHPPVLGSVDLAHSLGARRQGEPVQPSEDRDAPQSGDYHVALPVVHTAF